MAILQGDVVLLLNSNGADDSGEVGIFVDDIDKVLEEKSSMLGDLVELFFGKEEVFVVGDFDERLECILFTIFFLVVEEDGHLASSIHLSYLL